MVTGRVCNGEGATSTVHQCTPSAEHPPLIVDPSTAGRYEYVTSGEFNFVCGLPRPCMARGPAVYFPLVDFTGTLDLNGTLDLDSSTERIHIS